MREPADSMAGARPSANGRMAPAIPGQRGVVAWLTGLSGAGKSTIARVAEVMLREHGRTVFVLDGDEVRKGLCKGLGFSREDRHENLRRAGEVAALMADAGLVVIAAFITPEAVQRSRLRTAIGSARFLEVHVATSLEVCELRDPKGLYRRARAGEIPDFTGVDAAFEVPVKPDLVLATEGRSAKDCAMTLVAALAERGHIDNVASRPRLLG